MRQPAALAPLLARLASQTAQVLNVSSAGRAVGLAASTASDYVRLFEAAFLVRLLPAWGRTLRSATGSRPKLHMVDSGLAARLLSLPPDKLSALDPAALQQFDICWRHSSSARCSNRHPGWSTGPMSVTGAHATVLRWTSSSRTAGMARWSVSK